MQIRFKSSANQVQIRCKCKCKWVLIIVEVLIVAIAILMIEATKEDNEFVQAEGWGGLMYDSLFFSMARSPPLHTPEPPPASTRSSLHAHTLKYSLAYLGIVHSPIRVTGTTQPNTRCRPPSSHKSLTP